ncbi:MAG: M10 family metallopeptidase C-terminal domain-containing protein, partial [Hyphomonadaceae bacterium]|nr:M10 family metallopeptidase C-terminal domain-containing protein [Hyphomonadaceae bacterium]
MSTLGEDAIPGGTSTTAALEIGGVGVSSSIDSAGDSDWFRVELVAGQHYVFTLTGDGGTPLANPFLELRHSSGQILSIDDDGGAGPNALMQFTATWSGVYYLSARSEDNQSIGEYSISAAFGEAQDPLDTIDLGITFSTTEISIYFAQGGQQFGPAGAALRNWTSEERNAVLSALTTLSNVADLTFSVTNNASEADFVLVLSDLEEGVLGQAWPDPVRAHIEFDPSAIGWTTAGLLPGGLGYSVIIHEIAHGLGLGHPHLDGDDIQVMQGVLNPFGSGGFFELNQQVFTIMSYNDGWFTGPDGQSPNVNYGFAATPMALDIGLLQRLYGANLNHNSSDTTYVLPATGDGAYVAIWDTGGTDTITTTGALPVVIDLTAATLLNAEGGGGVVSYTRGLYGGLTIAHGVVIENAIGGSGDDVITGNAAVNRLEGGAGADTLHSVGGGDTLLGGAGADTLYALANDAVDGGADTDLLRLDLTAYGGNINFDLVAARGAAGATLGNVVVRNTERFEVQTGAGDDTFTLTSLTGLSWWWGGAGVDRLVADFSLAAVSVSLSTGWLSGGSAGENRLETFDIESFQVFGGSAGDGMSGGNFADELRGNAGDDGLHGGGGADLVDGGDGNDAISGGAGNDTLTGGAGGDDIRGNAGVDVIHGGDGDDYLDGGDYAPMEADWMDGGAGRDRVVISLDQNSSPVIFNANAIESATGVTFSNGAHVRNAEFFTLWTGSGDDEVYANHTHHGSIWQGGAGTDRLHLDLSGATSAVTINYGVADPINQTGLLTTIIWGGVNFIASRVEAFSLTGGSAADQLIGHNGNDVLSGGAGVDTLRGGGGDDVIWWDEADAVRDGGAGFDILAFNGVAPTSYNLAADGFEAAEARLSDAGANAWATQTTLYNNAWQTDYVTTTFDDGTRTEMDHDQANAFAWSTNFNQYDAGGSLDVNVTVFDSGVQSAYDFDQANAFAWSSNWNQYAASGALDINVTVWGDGSETSNDFDADDAFNWTSNWISLDTLGELDLNNTVFDNGVQSAYDFDQADAFIWSSNWNQYAANGALDINVTVFDDGTSNSNDFDEANAFNWASNFN